MTLRSFSAKRDSLFNIFIYTLSRFRAVTLFYSVLLAVLGPLFLLLQFFAGRSRGLSLMEYLWGGIALVMALAAPILIFSYINNKQALDVFHAAPVRRTTLYWGGYLAGLAMVLVPLAVFGSASLAIRLLEPWNWDEALLLLLNFIVAAFASYNIMVFVLVNCGTLFESIVYYLTLNGAYPALVATIFAILEIHTFGYRQGSGVVAELLYSFSPYYVFANDSWAQFQLAPALIPLALGGALAVAGGMLYQKRKSEAAGRSFAYRPLFYLGAVLASFSAGMAFLLLNSEDGVIRASAVILANLIAVIVYAILDTIRNRGFRQLRQTAVVSLSAAAAASAVFAAGALTGTFGYETRVPAADQISRVQVEFSLSLSDDVRWWTDGSREVVLEDPESIGLVLEFHRSLTQQISPIRQDWSLELGEYLTLDHTGARTLRLIGGYDRYAFDDGRYAQSEYGTGTRVDITYELKNGQTISRRYRNYPFVLTKPLYRLIQTEEFLSACYEQDLAGFDDALLGQDDGDRTFVIEVANLSYNGASANLDLAQTAALRQAMELDRAARPADFFVTPEAQPMYEISMRYSVGQGWHYVGSCGIYDSDRSTLALLEEWDVLTEEEPAEEAVPVGYIPKERMDEIMGSPLRDLGIFYQAGRSSFYDPNKRDSYEIYQLTGEATISETAQDQRLYDPLFVSLEPQAYDDLLDMVTRTRFIQEAGDVVILDGTCYLVFPQFEEAVRALIFSAEEYVPEPY